MGFIIINGEIVRKADANLTHILWDEPFILSQNIWYGFGGIPFFYENIDTICNQLEVFKIEVPGFLKNKRELFRITKRMLNKNKYYRSGIINFHLFLTKSKIEYAIISNASDEFEFPFSQRGLLVKLTEQKKHSENQLNKYSFYNKTNWQIEKSHVRNNSFHSSIFLNEKGMICEGISANIFMLKENALITPSLESGCVEDTLRTHIIEIAIELQLNILELENIKSEHLFEMSEIFFASEKNGIQWVLGFGNKRYVHQVTNQIHKKLNDYLKEKVN